MTWLLGDTEFFTIIFVYVPELRSEKNSLEYQKMLFYVIKWSRQYCSLMLLCCQFYHSFSWVVQLYWDFNRYVILIEQKEGLIWQNYRAANNSQSSDIGRPNLLVSDKMPPVFGHYSMFGEFFVVNHFNIVRMISNSRNNIELGNQLNEISWPVH